MKILVTGAAGMLGSSLVPALIEAGHDVIPTDIDLRTPSWGDAGPAMGLLDVREGSHVRSAVDQLGPDLVAHLAAETDLERCDADVDAAYLTNAIGTKHVALSCQRAEIPMVYISTAGVFDGTKVSGPYTEFDTPNPINTYGASKLAGEHYVQTMLPRCFIIRAGWMVGGGPGKDHKFVAKMIDQIREGRTLLHAVGDKLGTPTYTRDFARTFINLIGSGSYGLYHMACEGEGSRYDVAEHILAVLGLAASVELLEVDSSYFAEQFPSERPRSEIMRNMALELQGMNLMRPWREALEEYLLENFADLAADAVAV